MQFGLIKEAAHATWDGIDPIQRSDVSVKCSDNQKNVDYRLRSAQLHLRSMGSERLNVGLG